jgi:predicted nucleotidyltransferase
MQDDNFVATLRRLCETEIQFVLVGGLASALHGAPVQTYDVDVVYSLDPTNIDRLLEALQSLNAVFRMQPERRLQPNRRHLVAGGHLNLLTSFGPLDLLGTIGQNLGYSDLLPHSREMDVGQGIRVWVLDLETIISIKEQLASEKDLAVLPTLRRTLSETRKKNKS